MNIEKRKNRCIDYTHCSRMNIVLCLKYIWLIWPKTIVICGSNVFLKKMKFHLENVSQNFVFLFQNLFVFSPLNSTLGGPCHLCTWISMRETCAYAYLHFCVTQKRRQKTLNFGVKAKKNSTSLYIKQTKAFLRPRFLLKFIRPEFL